MSKVVIWQKYKLKETLPPTSARILAASTSVDLGHDSQGNILRNWVSAELYLLQWD